MPLELQPFLARLRVPDADFPGLVEGSPCTGQVPAVGAERQTQDRVGAPAEGQALPPGRNVPDLHGAVVAGRGQAVAVRAERGLVDPLVVAAEGEQFLTGLRVPDLHGPILAGGGQPPAVGAEDHAGDAPSVSPAGEGVWNGAEPAPVAQRPRGPEKGSGNSCLPRGTEAC